MDAKNRGILAGALGDTAEVCMRATSQESTSENSLTARVNQIGAIRRRIRLYRGVDLRA